MLFLRSIALGCAATLVAGGLAVLLGIAVGAQVGGIVGALIAIPVLAFGLAFIRSLRGVPVAGAEDKGKP